MNGLVILAAAAAIVFGINQFLKASPAAVADVVRRIGAWLLFGLATVLMLRGQFVLALPAAILAWLALGKAKSMSSILGGAGDKSSGQRSRVRTDMLEMELDHDTGEMRGVVLSGKFAGHELSNLELEDLRKLYRECVTAGPQASSLLEAYLDRAHPDWREGADIGGEGQEHGATGSSAMTREEAFEILGLPYGANESDIRQAHRSLMKSFHPDQGGSSYLASKINQAKDLLLE